MKSIKTVFYIFVIFLCFSFLQCDTTDRNHATKYSPDQLREDLNRFKELIYDTHPKYFTNMEEFNSTFERQFALLKDSLTELEFIRILAPVASKVKCGHTRLLLSDATYDYIMNQSKLIPLDIKVINDSLYVYQNFSDNTEITPGWAIIAINGQLSVDVINQLKESRPADGENETYKYYALNDRFSMLYTIYIRESEDYEITFLNPNTKTEITKTIKGKTGPEIKGLRAQHDKDEKEYQHISSYFSDDNKYAILDIKTFCFYENREDFNQPVGDFFKKLIEKGTKSLILDVRENDGGDPYCATYLLSHIINKSFPYFSGSTPFYGDLKTPLEIAPNAFDGDLYILTDGFCFSTTGHLCSLLRYHKIGTFIGEETGGSFACNDASTDGNLINTGISFNLPRRTFKTEVKGLEKGRGIMPDFEIRASIQDIIEKRDIVLEKTISLIDKE